jgi:hypothetical protein
MNKYDEMFKQEQTKIAIEKDLATQEKEAKIKVIMDFCEEHIFDFLNYLQNKFYVEKHSINYHVDREVYKRDIVYDYSIDNPLRNITHWNTPQLRTGIQYKWSNGGISDSLVVSCFNFKPVLEYEGKQMTPDEFKQTVVAQIQATIEKNHCNFKIIEK